jgi:hypothetical protein
MDNSQSTFGNAAEANAYEESSFVAAANANQQNDANAFVPRRPESIQDAGLQLTDLYPLALKYLFLHGNRSGNQIARQLKLPYEFISPAMESLKADLLVVHKTSAGIGDYEYELTPKGIEQARLHLARSTYCGSAPVSIAEYQDSVLRQSIRNLAPKFEDVAGALSDLEVTTLTINQMGQAINSGKSMFLFGAPGNGKTSLAKRAINSISEILWIPRAITVGGEVIRMFDPSVHKAMPIPESSGLIQDDTIDERWIRIHRPTIVVGGELEMKHLEATLNPVTGIIEAPIHVKSNCGCLVVDDFGRQQISTTALLNRWIVPMESGNDYLNLPSGRQVSLPFDQFLVFSTNLEPSSLCDEAFLRRIPYKIEVFDPTEEQFLRLFNRELVSQGFEVEQGAVEQLVEYHYKRANRPFRFCHVVDLIDQCRDFCDFHNKKLQFNRDIAELAVLNYFAGMGNP